MSPYPITNILFLDIETVPLYPAYDELTEEWKKLWSHKAGYLVKPESEDSPETIYNRAGIYAEFGKIICISCGFISGSGADKKFSLKSFYGDDEIILLQQFTEMLNRWSPGQGKYLCAHNGREFDFPYLCRRLIVHNQPIPHILNSSGKKPWEVPHLDTMDMWKFGDYKNYTSLNLLATLLGIPTPKDDIDGSMIYEVYWQQHDLDRIVTYCQKDVVTVAQIFLRLQGESTIRPELIDIK
jgi:predicted PolB exonuclease-like 3'-5' exonuclease